MNIGWTNPWVALYWDKLDRTFSNLTFSSLFLIGWIGSDFFLPEIHARSYGSVDMLLLHSIQTTLFSRNFIPGHISFVNIVQLLLCACFRTHNVVNVHETSYRILRYRIY